MARKLTAQERILRKLKRDKKKNLPYTIITLAITMILMIVFSVASEPPKIKVSNDKNTIFTATMAGDVMMGRNVEYVTNRYGQDYLFRYVKPYLESSDYVVSNFEHPVVLQDGYTKAEKYIHLKTSKESVETLKNLNFSAVTIANNHLKDYGKRGLVDTLNTFKEVGLDAVGAGLDLEDSKKISYQTKNNVKVALLGFTDSFTKGARALELRSGVLAADPEIFLPLINEAKMNADLVIVNVHWGQEYDNEAHPRQKEIAKAMVDAGADIIVGHHPHVLSSVEVYKNSVIFYSLGNFVFDQGWTRTRDSAIVQYKLHSNGKAKIEVTPLRIREATPKPIGKLGYFHAQKIFRTLTKDTPNKDEWKIENGKLTYELDHSNVLKEVATSGK
ncbi:CapA family protein [Bacillus sp. FJAT-49732]|uniref:CapA family protein n=1 Tax=Lederbergia citrisecunda TaxID=2833583 RepID=A0A942TJ45_9BACI|nr:CapA family protein [Lederbergia citrisecunda]MBS4198473.1 CapA family protein [Lederbergia citrisecunda]